MVTLLAGLTARRPNRVLIASVVLLAGFVFRGAQAFPALISSGFDDPNAETTKAAAVIDDRFGGPDDIAIVVNAPSGATVGDAAVRRAGSLVDRLARAAGWIVLTTFILVFLFTGSVLTPIKAVLMNVITLTAVLGAMTWIFRRVTCPGCSGSARVRSTARCRSCCSASPSGCRWTTNCS